jgi:hypothetical protein
MKNVQRSDYVTREELLKLLSDDEVARVSTAEAAVLAAGDQYIELDHLNHGVRKARRNAPPMTGVLPRKSVQEATWTKIVARLAEPRVQVAPLAPRTPPGR